MRLAEVNSEGWIRKYFFFPAICAEPGSLHFHQGKCPPEDLSCSKQHRVLAYLGSQNASGLDILAAMIVATFKVRKDGDSDIQTVVVRLDARVEEGAAQ